MTTVRIELPPKLIPVFSGTARYRCSYGGRGSGKTRSFALMSAVKGYEFGKSGISGQILCGREHLNSLSDSSLEEIKSAIRSVPWLNDYYEIGENFIRSKDRRINYLFAGLRHNLDSIKSKARIILAWVDEAESVSEVAWRKLTPTVREDNSEIWVTWNRESPESATNRRFIINPPENSKITELNWSDNPWFPAVLDEERRHDLAADPDHYEHVWGGAYLTLTDAQVFKNKFRVEQFEPHNEWNGPYFGLDFGFANDPSAGVESYVADNNLYIRREAGKVGLELDDTAKFMLDRIPLMDKHDIRADSARPESISYLRRHGLPRIKSVEKWPGSIEDGVKHIRSYNCVIIHPDCVETAREFRLYAHKIDRLSGDVLPAIIDKFNHYMDAIRYAVAPIIRQKSRPRVRML